MGRWYHVDVVLEAAAASSTSAITRLWGSTEATTPHARDRACVTGRAARYAVVFREAGQASVAGAVTIEDGQLRLQGRRGTETIELDLSCESLHDVRIGHASEERLNGRPTIILTRIDGAAVEIAPLRAGTLGELIDLLHTLAASRTTARLVVRAPLRDDVTERARALIAEGPPFDPDELELERHDVYLGSGEVLFLLEGPIIRAPLERMVRDPWFWRAGLRWRDLLSGTPTLIEISDAQLADRELVYRWASSPAVT